MKKHIFFVNAHPDDIITALGTAIKIRDTGRYVIHVVDVTHGDRGLVNQGIGEAECAAMRDLEERAVCGKLGCEPVWLKEHDGLAFASEASCRQLADLYLENPPAAIFTQWPVDTHFDHVICAAIAMNALRMASGVTEGTMKGKMPEMYFYHYVSNSRADHPTHYVPLTEQQMQEKKELISLYRCQNGPGMADDEERTNRFYGTRIRRPFAEAYTSFQPSVAAEPLLLETPDFL